MHFLKQLHLNRDGTCTESMCRQAERAVGRSHEDISAGRQRFWCLNDGAPSLAADRAYAAMSEGSAPVESAVDWKRGEMQTGRPKWMNNRPAYKDMVD